MRAKKSSRTKPDPRHRRIIVPRRDQRVQHVMRALEGILSGRSCAKDPMLEQLRQCPEAFKAGEILGKLFDSVRYTDEEETPEDRCLPPAGVVVSPFC